MFDEFSAEELEQLRRAWKSSVGSSPKERQELQGGYWYKARIIDVKASRKNGKPRVQIFFDVVGNRLVKDFWLTEKGIYVFQKFLAKFGISVDSIQELQASQLRDRSCEVLISPKELQKTRWLEIADCRTDSFH